MFIPLCLRGGLKLEPALTLNQNPIFEIAFKYFLECDIMETFTAPKTLVDNPHFSEQRKQCLAMLSDEMIDPPILDIIQGFNQYPFCFTLQACYGHRKNSQYVF
jgi:hypothetical protein